MCTPIKEIKNTVHVVQYTGTVLNYIATQYASGSPHDAVSIISWSD